MAINHGIFNIQIASIIKYVFHSVLELEIKLP